MPDPGAWRSCQPLPRGPLFAGGAKAHGGGVAVAARARRRRAVHCHAFSVSGFRSAGGAVAPLESLAAMPGTAKPSCSRDL